MRGSRVVHRRARSRRKEDAHPDAKSLMKAVVLAGNVVLLRNVMDANERRDVAAVKTDAKIHSVTVAKPHWKSQNDRYGHVRLLVRQSLRPLQTQVRILISVGDCARRLVL